ncbi:MAG: BACON domain-containing carbohydrate-binding protein [Rikenellaceae bacterium]
MKTIDKLQNFAKFITTSICFLLLLGSCTRNEIDSQPETADYFTVTATVADEISFAENSDNKFSVEGNVWWEATVSQDEQWCTLSGYSSDQAGLKAEIYIYAEANLSTDPRSATISFNVDGVSCDETITVTQMGYGAEIVLSESELSVIAAAGSTATFTVTSTSTWTIAENDYFSFDPSVGEGDPYLKDEPTLVTATAKSTNVNSTDIVTTMYISNEDGKEASIEFTQQKSVSLDFADSSDITAAAAGEVLSIEVETDSDSWKMYCSNSSVSIDYSKFESEGVVEVTIPKNATFASRSMTLSLKSDDGLMESTSNILVSQDSANSFNYVQYMLQGNYSISEDGALTINNTGAAKTRILSNEAIYGMGKCTIKFDNYEGDSASYINFHAQDTGTDLVNLAIGPGLSSSYFRNTANTINSPPSLKVTLDHLQAMTEMVISILPDETDGTKMNLVVELSNDSGVLYNYSLQTTNFYTADPDFTNDMTLYFGLCSSTAPTSGSNTMTISSFDFVPYDPSVGLVPDSGDDSTATVVPFSLFTNTDNLYGTKTLINDGEGVTLTHTSGGSSRIGYSTTDLLFGTYNFNISDYQGSSDSSFNMHLDINGYTTDRVILYVGPGAPVTIVKVDGTVVNTTTVNPTLEQMEATVNLEVSILPKADDDSKIEVTTTLYDASGTAIYTKSIENINYSDSVAPYDIIYCGLFGTPEQSITIESLTYKPYVAAN